MKNIYITADFETRYDRWRKRQRDTDNYSKKRFEEINELQDMMGLIKIKEMDNIIIFENNSYELRFLHEDFQKTILKEHSTSKKVNETPIKSISKLSLEKSVLITLALEYKKNESAYYTTTEISHLINNYFEDFNKNKNNISRYFNQSYYPYYEIKKENRKNKYKLSPTGYSEAVFLIKETLTAIDHNKI